MARALQQCVLVRVVREHPLATFYALALALTWAWWVPLAALGVTVRPGIWPTHAPGLLGPAVAALVITGITGGQHGLREVGRRLLRWRIGLVPAVAIASPLVLFALAVVIESWTGHPRRSVLEELGTMNGFPVGSAVTLWLLLILVNGVGEEVGWRGFAFERLRHRHGLLQASLLVVPVWALWHVPSFFVLETYRAFGFPQLVGFVLGLASGAVFLGWLYEISGRSLFAVALWHGTFNLVSATRAARGLPAAVVTTAVMIAAVLLVIVEVRGSRRRRRAEPAAAPG